MGRITVSIVALPLLAMAACATEAPSGSDAIAATSRVGSVSSALSASAAKASVPRDLLVAIAKVEDGLALPRERADINIDIDNEVPAAGPLQLRRGKLDTLLRGAQLVHAREIDLRMHGDLALEAGALVLAELGAKTGARPDDLASWSEAIAEMSGYADDVHREHYVHRVYATLARGGHFEGRDGENEIVDLPSHDELPPSLIIDVSQKLHTLADAQYEGAEWIPTSCTNKCTPTRAGNAVELIVIHDTEGNWDASVATLQNDPDKSVQYIIGVDGRVAQFVTEETTAWHAGNFSVNQRSVGIEHVGYATKPFAEAEYAASAKLVDHLAKKYNVPRDRAHIIGHDQVPNGNKIAQASPPCSQSPKQCAGNANYGGASNHSDPGIWEWATFMARFDGNAKCNDITETLTCSNDNKQAFRCAADKVEVRTCASTCVPGGESADATCNVAPSSSTPPGTATPPTDTRTPSGFLPPANNGSVREEPGGCAVVVSTRPTAPSWVVVLGAIALVVRLRKRRSP